MKEIKKFEKLFGQGTTKAIGNNKMEFRVKGDLDIALQNARNIISNNKLNLIARTTGMSSSYGAFEVVTNS